MSAAYAAYSEAMGKAGVVLGGNRLRPTAEATTVRVKDGKTEVLDGPYADTKEQLGGYYLIDVPDLDAALSWAARCPTAANGTIEVRPIWPMQLSMPGERASRRARRRAVARGSYGKLVAYLAARTRDVAAAEDALVRRLRGRARRLAASSGIPQSPEAWLLAVARRKAIDAARRRRTGEERRRISCA